MPPLALPVEMFCAELRLKLTRPVDLNARARTFFDAPDVRSQVTPAAREEVERLHVKRNQLCNVKLSITTAEDAAREFVNYASRLARFERRLEHGGRELGVRFAWKDAFKSRQWVEKLDFGWERACALFNAAACYAFLGATEHERGAVDGALRAAKLHFEAAAGCFSTVHDLVRANVWGLNPKWDPQSLSPDMHVDLLAAFKTLMLAQAQCAVCEKAVADSLRASSKLAAQAAALFREARYTFERPTHSQYLGGEGGRFSGANRAWIARVRANEEIFEAMAHELLASEAAAASNYGEQVARLRLARAHAEEAERRADRLGDREKQAVSALCSKLQHSASVAEKQNVNIYHQQVPSLTALNLHLSAGPMPPKDDTQGQPDPLCGLLPPALTTALQRHFAEVESKLDALTTRSSADALRCQEALSSHRMPEALEACETDTKLPERIVRAIVEAQKAGSLSDLRSQLDLCGNRDDEALEIINRVGGLLRAEEDKDKQFRSKNPALSLSQLRASAMSKCSTELHAARDRLRQAVDATHRLRERLDEASDEIALIEAPVEQLAQQMPHKDGTPLSNEPCVPALYGLMHRLSQIKVQAEEWIAGWRRLKAEQQQSAALGEALLAMEATDVQQQKLREELQPYVEAAVEYRAFQRQREELLAQVDEQARLFEDAQRDGSPVDARQRYRRQLSLGAEEASAIAKGLAERVAFYKEFLSQLRRTGEQASQLADERAKERDELVNPEPRRITQAFERTPRLSARTIAQKRQGRSAAPPSIIKCCACKKEFRVPPHTLVTACPRCSTHNRVPDA